MQSTEMRSKLSIRFGTSPDHASSMWSSRGLAKVPSEISPSQSSASLCTPIHVYIQDSPKGSPGSLLAAPLSDNPETRNHSEVSFWI